MWVEWKDWFEIYHTIGNFTFYPKEYFEYKKHRPQNAIGIFHNSMFDERWDLTLSYIKRHWNKEDYLEGDEEIPYTFEEYMIMSCQQFGPISSFRTG